MKRILCLLLATALGLALCGCDKFSAFFGKTSDSGEESSAQTGSTPHQITTPTGATTEAPEATAPTEETEEAPTPTEAVPEATAPEVKTITMPHFLNQPLTFATDWLYAEGIAVTIEYAPSTEVEAGSIISQSIPHGQKITTAEVVVLTVSQGFEACPYDYSQKLTVAAAPGSTFATAILYEWENGDWQPKAKYDARVAYNGIGTAYEGSRLTPMGIYRLGVVLTAGTIHTNLPVHTASSSTCVVNDTGSSYYNIIMDRQFIPSGVSFDPIGEELTNGTIYASIYIEHNGNGLSSQNVVPGRGSAIGLRGQYGDLNATYGDVDLSYTDFIDLLSRLDASKNPVIEIVLN